MSLSSRRAWIEINAVKYINSGICVALLTESVDWNRFVYLMIFITYLVALLTESVDWNCTLFLLNDVVRSRSPHGERGLKLDFKKTNPLRQRSLSSRRAWIEITFFNPREFGRSGRSPHGERGLKCLLQKCRSRLNLVALLAESVDWNK